MTKIKKFLFSNYEFIFCIILFVIILQMALNPTPYIDASLSGLIVFSKIVLPSLFCFFFLTKIFMQLNTSITLFSLIGSLFNRFYGVPKESGYIFAMSVISGYPVGAKLLSEFYQKGAIDEIEAKKMIAFCSTSGPMFILGSLSHLLDKSDIGVIILISHFVATLLNGLIYSRLKKSKKSTKNAKNNEILIKNDKKIRKNEENITKKDKKIDINSIMYDTILSVFMVGGFITLCFTLIRFIGENTVFNSFRQFAYNLTGSDIMFSIFSGIIEMTSGCLALSEMTLSRVLLASSLCALVTFGGLSIHLQSNIFLSKIGIKYRYFLLTKFTQTLLSVIICIPLCLII